MYTTVNIPRMMALETAAVEMRSLRERQCNLVCLECPPLFAVHPFYGIAWWLKPLPALANACKGTLNLFVAGWTAKKFGPRLALAVQTVVPALRVATQVLGVFAGGMAGMLIIQCTQLITIVGGPAGYM